ncbi:MAG: FadR family transcriptional regulator [Alphaproteobacteria bacterium]|nr:FadR family transcriptional regulator [Alphaproteobacteria bacterium]
MSALDILEPDDADLPSGAAAGAGTLSEQIVARVRDALFAGRLKPGDMLGTEKDIAARFDASRIVARDALKRLEAAGVVEIRVGKGGGARIAHGNPQLFADALAVQLNLIGVGVAEILDAQRAIETMTAELAATHATRADLERMEDLLARAEASCDDFTRFTRLSLAFHLAVAEAAHNDVLRVQLISLQHVAWPKGRSTLTRDVAEHIVALHRELYVLIKARDGEGARELMSRHLRQIRARRLSEAAPGSPEDFGCC